MHFIFLAVQDPISEISFLYSMYVWRNLYNFFLPTLENCPWLRPAFTLDHRVFYNTASCAYVRWKNCVAAYQKPDSKEHESLIYPHKSIHINLKSPNHLTFLFEDKIKFCKFSTCHIKATFSSKTHHFLPEKGQLVKINIMLL